MIKNKEVTIALLGNHPEILDWKEKVILEFEKLKLEFPDNYLEVDFIETVNPSQVPFIPIGALGAQVVDLIFCREHLLGASADIAILIDSGVDNKTLEHHTERICEKSKAVILWSPLIEKSFSSNKKDEIGAFPGCMYLTSNASILARCLYFLCIGSDAVEALTDRS